MLAAATAGTMTLNVALWVIAVTTLPAIGWAFTMTVMMMSMKRDCTKLVHMHEHADEFGVALRAQADQERAEMRTLIADNNRAMLMLVHYIKWFIKEQTGSEPPPPLPAKINA